VRYVVADDPKQLALAEGIIEECGENEEPVFLSVLVLCELVWVLDRSYQQSKAQMLNVMDTILRKNLFHIEHYELVRRSVQAWRHGKKDFAGYLIGEIASRAGCRDTVTLDRGLKGSAGFTFLA
jgi:predicted nucleic-acid-binding protein